MSKIKMLTKKCLPKSFLYRYKYSVNVKNSKKTYAGVENELQKKYEKVFGRKINWEKPTTYNEKINVAELYCATPIKTRLSDKIQVSDWVKEKLGDECKIIPLIGVYNSVDEIDFSKLPECYAMKMNNDSGSIFVCDKKHPITKNVLYKYRHYLEKRNFAYNGFEMQYKNIKPKVMIEKYMGEAIRDYKFQCFNGEVYSCRVDFDRFSNHTRNFYNKNWELLEFNKGNFKNKKGIKKPKNFKKMWKMAEKLGADFDQVRVDFYDIDGAIYFGEMTFTNGAGLEKFYPDKIDFEMGKLWNLDMKKVNKCRQKLLFSNKKIGDKE